MAKVLIIFLSVCLSPALFASSGSLVDNLDEFFDSLPVWLTTATTVVTVATAITAITPTKSDDVVLGTVLKVLNILAGNIGKNRNRDDKPVKS